MIFCRSWKWWSISCYTDQLLANQIPWKLVRIRFYVIKIISETLCKNWERQSTNRELLRTQQCYCVCDSKMQRYWDDNLSQQMQPRSAIPRRTEQLFPVKDNLQTGNCYGHSNVTVSVIVKCNVIEMTICHSRCSLDHPLLDEPSNFSRSLFLPFARPKSEKSWNFSRSQITVLLCHVLVICFSTAQTMMPTNVILFLLETRYRGAQADIRHYLSCKCHYYLRVHPKTNAFLDVYGRIQKFQEVSQNCNMLQLDVEWCSGVFVLSADMLWP